MEDVKTRFIEQMGLHGETHGFSRIGGRLLGLFMISDEPRSLDELADELGVSKASISTNARVLESHGLLERVSRPGDRRDYYHLGSDPWENMFQVNRQRMTSLLDILGGTLEELPAGTDARSGLARWHSFLAFILDDLDRRIERWREHLADIQDREANDDQR